MLIPFCIYHYIDIKSNTFLGYIGYPENGITSQLLNVEISKEKVYNQWFLYAIFYAFSHVMRPIPYNFKLINFIISDKFPYNIEDVVYVYDPFDIKNNVLSCITWTTPVNNTVELFLYTDKKNSVFPSFEKKPPSESIEWNTLKISPLFVITNNGDITYDIGENGQPIINFIIENNSCMPSKEGLSLENCFLQTDIKKNSKVFSKTLLGQLRDERGLKKSNGWIIVVILICIIVLIFFIWINFYRFKPLE